MQYKKFKDGISLSRLGMGAMRLPVKGSDAEIDYEKAKAIIDTGMKSGINYYDTAYIYHGGKSEEFLGEALKTYPRDSFYVADKYNLQAEPDFERQFAEQLRRLQMDHIDFYLLHGIQDNFAEEILNNGCIEYFDKLKQEGKIRYLGFSFHGSPQMLERIIQAYPWDFAQMQLNYYDWYCGDAKVLYEILEQAGIPVMVMEPVHGGMLANLRQEAADVLQRLDSSCSQASWAMRWVLDHPQVQVVLSGMSDSAQLADNVGTFDQAKPLTDREYSAIREAASLQYAAVAVACTGCRYCCPNCPMGLDIPLLLRAYNEAKIGGAWRLTSVLALPEEKRPTSCIGCGACTKHCPQSFDVPGYMSEMKRMMSR